MCTLLEILDTDAQPQWADTLHDPKPEAEDYAPDEVPESVREKPEPVVSIPPQLPALPPLPMLEPEPSPPGPAGAPVGKALDVQAKGDLSKVIKSTVDAIESVHGDGSLPTIPMKETGKGTAEGTFYKYIDDRPIEIKLHKKASSPRMTSAHEIGHFLDNSGIPKTHAGYGGKMHRDFAHEPQFAEWRQAVQKSEAVLVFEEARKRGYFILGSEKTPQGMMQRQYKIDEKHAKYLASDEERWARSYAQYIATKSQDAEMLAELAKHRATNYSVAYNDQWSEADFKPIAAAFDKLFTSLGWIR